MKNGAGLTVGIIVALVAGGGGYWLGDKGSATQPAGGVVTATGTTASAGEAARKERKLLYYRNPMGLPDTSPTPKKDPMGMDYLPVPNRRL